LVAPALAAALLAVAFMSWRPDTAPVYAPVVTPGYGGPWVMWYEDQAEDCTDSPGWPDADCGMLNGGHGEIDAWFRASPSSWPTERACWDAALRLVHGYVSVCCMTTRPAPEWDDQNPCPGSVGSGGGQRGP